MKKLTILGLFCTSLILVNAQSKIKYDLDNKIIELSYMQNQRSELKDDQKTYQLTGKIPSSEPFIDSRNLGCQMCVFVGGLMPKKIMVQDEKNAYLQINVNITNLYNDIKNPKLDFVKTLGVPDPNNCFYVFQTVGDVLIEVKTRDGLTIFNENVTIRKNRESMHGTSEANLKANIKWDAVEAETDESIFSYMKSDVVAKVQDILNDYYNSVGKTLSVNFFLFKCKDENFKKLVKMNDLFEDLPALLNKTKTKNLNWHDPKAVAMIDSMLTTLEGYMNGDQYKLLPAGEQQLFRMAVTYEYFMFSILASKYDQAEAILPTLEAFFTRKDINNAQIAQLKVSVPKLKLLLEREKELHEIHKAKYAYYR